MRAQSVWWVAAGVLAMAGCSGSNGTNGSPGRNGTDGTDATAYGTLAGTVDDAYGNLVAGATVSYSVVGEPVPRSTTAGAGGAYSITLPAGTKTVTFAATGYAAQSRQVEILPGQPASLDVTLNPVGKLAVTVRRTDTLKTVQPGNTVNLATSVFVFDPSLTGTPTYTWTVQAGPAPAFSSATAANPALTLAGGAAFKQAVVERAAPRYTWNPDEPPVNVDRYQVVPFSYDDVVTFGNVTKVKVVVTVGGESAEATFSVPAKIPAVPSTGLAAVPVNSPVVLQGQFPFKKDGAYVFDPQAAWSWAAVGPGGAAVALNDPASAYPDFTPAVAGSYTIYEGTSATPRLVVWAGTFAGAMEGAGAPKVACAGCHGAKFSTWLQTGHKEVIWAGIAEPLPDGHYTSRCTPCHTVGIGLKGAGGFADPTSVNTPDFSLLQGSSIPEERYWELYPDSAPVAGIQCENCHGPQNAARHNKEGAMDAVGTSRVTFSSSTCATCHARIPKHGRYPQWLQSGHASYATFTYNSAGDGKLSKGCACCHSAQGFKAYQTALALDTGNRNATVLPAGLTIRNAEPISCPTCHVAHDEGDAGKVEWVKLAQVGPAEGATYLLPGGFSAVGVGKGALCIACHNSRAGYFAGQANIASLHEDGDPTWGSTTYTSYTAPHEACQGDVLLGRNAFWMGADKYDSPATRSRHSFITDSCVGCHMRLTTIDPAYGEEGQTRHDFKATPDVCNKCHYAYSAESVQAVFDDRLLDLKDAVGTAILKLKYDGAIPAGTTARLVANRSGQVDVTDGTGTHRWFIGNKTNQDAFFHDPNSGGAVVSGCGTPYVNSEGMEAVDCDGFLKDAPGVTAIGSDATRDATVTAGGVSQVVVKALWNTVLVQDDASRGIHAPQFTSDVMESTISHVSTFTR